MNNEIFIIKNEWDLFLKNHVECIECFGNYHINIIEFIKLENFINTNSFI